MRIGLIGTGRMGRILAARMATENDVVIYDANSESAITVAKSLHLKTVVALVEMDVDAVVLAVPDSAIGECLGELRQTNRLWNVYSVATNISREMLAGMSGGEIRSLNVKIIGHAGEMSRGARPVVVIDDGDPEMIRAAQQIFKTVGTVLVGNADQVKQINSVATEEALKAAVSIECLLRSSGIADAEKIRGALSQVAPGVLRAYAEDDLGPFARSIVCSLRDKSNQRMI